MSDDETCLSARRTVGASCACLFPSQPLPAAFLGSPALLPSPRAGIQPHGRTTASHRVQENSALCGILDAAGRCGENLSVCNQTTPYPLHSLHSEAVLII